MVRQCLVPYPTLPYPTLLYPTILTYPTLPYPTLPYPTLPYRTVSYPTLSYLTLTPTPTSNPPPSPTPLNPTPHTTPTPYTYPTLPYPTQPLPYACPAIHRLAPPYPTLPYPSAVYVGLFRSVSVVLLSISVSESGLVLSFRFVSLQTVKVKAIGTDRMNSVKSVDSMPELSKLYNCRSYKCRIVTC